MQESAVSKLCELLQNVLPATLVGDIVALHFATVASCSKLLENENLFAGYFLLTGKRVTVYFEETSICLLKNLYEIRDYSYVLFPVLAADTDQC